MRKNMYSLILSEEVVREVDSLAHRMGTNRSNLINQILAEYVNYTTPERRINDILSAIEQLTAPSRELVPFFSPNASSMYLKSSLEYKYRPTVKYELELYRGGDDSIGQLTVAFRSTSVDLVQTISSFFYLWKSIEDRHLAPVMGQRRGYILSEGKFIIPLGMPDVNCSSKDLGKALSEYIQLFDSLLKAYLAGKLNPHEIEAAYYSHMINSKIHI